MVYFNETIKCQTGSAVKNNEIYVVILMRCKKSCIKINTIIKIIFFIIYISTQGPEGPWLLHRSSST